MPVAAGAMRAATAEEEPPEEPPELLLTGGLSAPFEFTCVRTLHPFIQTIVVEGAAVSLEIEDGAPIDATEKLIHTASTSGNCCSLAVTSASAAFVANGVVVGHELAILTGNDIGVYEITAVAATQVVLEAIAGREHHVVQLGVAAGSAVAAQQDGEESGHGDHLQVRVGRQDSVDPSIPPGRRWCRVPAAPQRR